MSTPTRSRWSNRDESSYQEVKSRSKNKSGNKPSRWRHPKVEYSASMLIIGQMTSVVALFMLSSGTNSTISEPTNGISFWGLGESSLAVTVIFALISFLFLFRVSISRKAPKSRRRIARIWLLATILASQLT